MSNAQIKAKQKRALELLLTMAVSMNRMESQETRYAYQGSREHEQHRRVILQLCKELGLDPSLIEDDVRRLVCSFMGEPTMMVPNREVHLMNDFWHPVTPASTKSPIIPPSQYGLRN